MNRSLPARIAWRYLISKKSHSAVGAISAVSICGMAVATAAIICVLSVFNGFKGVIADRLDTLTPDLLISPASGKVFENADSLASVLAKMNGVVHATPSLTDNALAVCDTREMPILLKGVDIDRYKQLTLIDSLFIDNLPDRDPQLSQALLSVGVASSLAAVPGQELLLFTPRRIGRVNLSNPAASFLTDSVETVAVFQSNQSDFDENLVIVDLDLARELLQYDSEASAIEIKLTPGADPQKISAELSHRLGPNFIVKDRLRQQEMNFRMISIEKWVTYLLLFFILLIASFNIISSLSMLVLEKLKSLSTLAAIGFNKKSIGKIFFWESIYVSIIGGGAGLIIGVAVCLIQQHFGIIKIKGDPQSLSVFAYPVILHISDIFLTLLPVIAIGLVSATITAAFARSRIALR